MYIQTVIRTKMEEIERAVDELLDECDMSRSEEIEETARAMATLKD